MIRKVFDSGVLQLIAILLVLVVVLTVVTNRLVAYNEVWLESVEVVGMTDDGLVELSAKGANMYRVNSLRINGRRVFPVRTHTEAYEDCRMFVKPETIEGAQTARVAKSFLLLAQIGSNEVPVSLKLPE